MKNVLVVFNVNAGRKKGIKYKKKLQKFLLKSVECFKFISIDELETFNAEPFDTIIAMGGDGTIHKVLPLINNKTLGIIPCGTANLLAEKLKIPSNLNRALKILQKENKKTIDLLKINNTKAVLRFGTGYDADIICKTPQSMKHKFGYFAYFIAGILFALRLKLKEYIFDIDGRQMIIKASCVIAANADNMYRNWISISKNSKPDDGLMEIFILTTTNPFIFFYELIRMIFKRHKNNSRAMYFRGKRFIIKNKWLAAHIDGEKKNFGKDIIIEVQRQSIKVICP